jgi:hypothetical protein
LMGNRRGDEAGRAVAASGYRNFTPFVGAGQILEANTEDNAPPEQRWISMLSANTFLWAYGCGGGQPTAISELGTHDQYNDVWSADVVGQDAKAVFVMLFGSWFGNWDGTDNIMRSFLATPTMGLASCMSGGPHWFLHHMGLGETIGYDTRLTMNNSTLYKNESNDFTRAIFIALMGDPTLRMNPVAPPANLITLQDSNSVVLTWAASSDNTILGYHVYRARSAAGPFMRQTISLLSTTSFSDQNPSAGTNTYMVRAVKLETTPSGSYTNISQGIFSSLVVVPIPILQASRTGNNVVLSWNSQPGASYRVQTRNTLSQTNWNELSGPVAANGTTTSWMDSNTSGPEKFYRLVSP